jgi:hypothetical protein
MGHRDSFVLLMVVAALSRASGTLEGPTVTSWDTTLLTLADLRLLLPSRLGDVIGPLADNATAYYYNPDAPLARLEGVKFMPPLYAWGPQRLATILQSEPGRNYYCSVPLASLSQPMVDRLAGLPERIERARTRGGLWLSSPGVTAAMHFDASGNWLSQLVGTKRVWLASPRAWQALPTYSALHPMARQAQPPFEGGPGAVEVALGGVGGGALDVRLEEVVLQPGQTLFIPAFYFHLVVVPRGQGPSVSVNTYLDGPHSSLLAAIHGRPPAASRAILGRVLGGAFASLRVDLAALARAVLDSRWRHLPSDRFLEGDLNASLGLSQRANDPASCGGRDGGSSLDAAAAEVAALVPLFEQVRALLPDAFELICADFLEAVAARSLGTRQVWRFLTCLAASSSSGEWVPESADD